MPKVKQNKLKKRRYQGFVNLDVFYELQIGDCATGKILSTERGRCYSFVKQFLQILLANMRGCRTFEMLDVNNTTIQAQNQYPYVTGPVNNASYGPVVGTGTTAATINDYALQTKIAHGTSAGQLQYSATSFGAPTTDSTSAYFVITRVFTNNSGSTITVNEIGIITEFFDLVNLVNTYHLLLRDVISARSILNGQFLTVNYSLKAIA